MPDYLRPDGDDTIGNWTDEASGTTTVYDGIDEATASQTDYAQSGENPINDAFRVTMTDPTAVDTSSAVTINYEYGKDDGGKIDLDVHLVEGTTTIASASHVDVVDGAIGAITLSAGEKGAVSNWNNVKLEFVANDGYAEGGEGPEIVADFEAATEYYRKAGTDSTFAGLFTHTRASTATYFDSNGDIQTATSGTERTGSHIYNGTSWVKAGLLLETVAATNVIENSTPNELITGGTSSKWRTAASFPMTVSLAAISSPVGSATKFISYNGTGTQRAFQEHTSFGNQTYTFSAFLKAAGYQYATLAIYTPTPAYAGCCVDLSTGTITEEFNSPDHTFIEDFGNGWYRVSVTATGNNGIEYTNIGISNTSTPGTANPSFTGNGTDGIYVDGVQAEAGPIATSLIETASAAATRAADDLVIGSVNHDLGNATNSALTIHMRGSINFADSGDGWFFYTLQSNTSNRVLGFIDTSTTNTGKLVFVSEGGGTDIRIESGASEYPPGREVAFNIAHATEDNRNAAAIDGTALTADTTTMTLPTLSAIDLELGYYVTTSDGFIGHIGLFRGWENVALSDANLEAATL